MGEMERLYFFVLSGAVLWAVSNVLKKKLLTSAVHEDYMSVVIFLTTAAVGFVNCLVFYGIPHIQADFWPAFAITAFINIFIQYLNIKALKYEDASIVAPLSSSMPLFLIFMSYVILGEYPTFWGRIGIATIALGAYVLYLGGEGVEIPNILKPFIPQRYEKTISYWAGPWIRLFSSKGARYALIVAWCGAFTINFDKIASLNSNPLFFSAAAFLFVACSIYGYSWVNGTWKTIQKHSTWSLVGVGVVFGIAANLMTMGIIESIVPYNGALKRTQILWTVVLAFLFLGEKYVVQRLVGSVIIITGIVLLGF